MSDALTREDLDAVGCDTPGCTHDHSVLVMNASCHPMAGLCVAYDKRSGALRITCGRCDKPVARVSVAGRVVQ